MNQKKQDLRDKIKREWIAEHKRSTKDDHIIFREDDELFSEEGQGLNQTLKSETTTARRGGKIGPLNRERMTDADWEAKFEMLMREDLIELPDEYQDERLYFENEGQLTTIFEELEETNLYQINQL